MEQTLDIIYRDDALVAVNKPSGLLVHRSGLASDRVTCMTLLRDQTGVWVYPVHRMDRGASGVLVFAVTAEAAGAVARQFADRSASKRYLAVTRGWAPESIDIDYPLDDDEKQGSQRVEARTIVRRIAGVELDQAVGRYSTARYSLVEARPHTGRRHQIRRHLAHIRHPIIGDRVHGEGRHNKLFRESLGIDRLLLHGRELEIEHPISGERMTLRAELTAELAALVERLGWSDEISALSIT